MKLIFAFVFIFSAFVFEVRAQDSKSVTVEVKVPIPEGNRAAAFDKAKADALRLAVEQSLPGGISAEEREAKLKNAAAYIKSFLPLEQVEEGGELRVKFKCEVAISDGTSHASSGNSNVVAYEFRWKPGRTPPLAEKVLENLKQESGGSVGLVRLQYGSLWVEARGVSDPERLRSSLLDSSDAAEVRLIRDPYYLQNFPDAPLPAAP